MNDNADAPGEAWLHRISVNGNNAATGPVYLAITAASIPGPVTRFILEVATDEAGDAQLAVISRKPRKACVRMTYNGAYPFDATLQTVDHWPGCRLDADLRRGATGPDVNTGYMVRACLIAALRLWPALQRFHLTDESTFTCVTPAPVHAKLLLRHPERDLLLHGSPWYSRAVGAVPHTPSLAVELQECRSRLQSTVCPYASFEALWAALAPPVHAHPFRDAPWLPVACAAAEAAFRAGTSWSTALPVLFGGDGAVALATTPAHACALYALLEVALVRKLRVPALTGEAWVVPAEAIAAYTDDVTVTEVPKPPSVGGGGSRRTRPVEVTRQWRRLC